MPRKIDQVLHFRNDLPPFLAHLTRRGDHGQELGGNPSAAENLRSIIESRMLYAGEHNPAVSDARFGINTYGLSQEEKRSYFQAISFTETPLSEVHCLLEIEGRSVNLEPYGVVFLKEELAARGVSPVWYINNSDGDQLETVEHLTSLLIEEHPETARRVLPLISAFGRKLKRQDEEIDFRWEREWRYPASEAPLSFTKEDVFIGLCPHDEIGTFESLFPPVGFIDPRRNMKWYANKLIDARQRLDMAHSVV